MVSHLFFYQLTLIVLVWLCVMLHWMWPSAPATCPMTPAPIPPGPKRTRKRKPFVGLTTKPPCEACAHASDPRPEAPYPPHHVSCPHGDDDARWTPPPISARIQTVPITAGSAGAISVPMAIPVAVPGGSGCVWVVVAIFSGPGAVKAHGRNFCRSLGVQVPPVPLGLSLAGHLAL